VTPTPSATPAPVTPTPSAADQEWPAPVTSAAAHPDDWDLETSAPTPSATPAPTPPATPAPTPPATPAPTTPAPVNPTGATELVATVSQPNVPQVVSDQGSAPTQWPPPTRVTPLEEPFKTPEVMPIPDVPEAGLWKALKYTVNFERARWQRRGAIKSLRSQMRQDTGMLDGILGALGKQARALGIDSKPLESENRAIAEAENRRKTADHECSELSNRQAEENSKFADSENERQGKVSDAESSLETAQAELGALEAQKKDLRDQGKTLDNRKKHYLKTAESRDTESGKQENSATRLEMRQGAQSLRADAAELDKERQDIERRIAALEKPIGQIAGRVGALKSDLDAAKRALTNLREGHRHRLAELEAELGRRTRELAQAEAEILRREVTLGTLVNLNRIERVEFQELYGRIDGLRGGIGARSNEIDKLSAEREAFDKASRIRGAIVLAGAFVLFCALLAILLSV
jgi:predicted  nucleic acid-binding Zn-ribbon protein